MEKILYLLGKKGFLRLYDILSIISISIYASKISFDCEDINVLKIIIYCFGAICIFSLYFIYQDYILIHEEVYKESNKDEQKTEKSYDEIYNEILIDGGYKKKLLIKLLFFVFSVIITLLLAIYYGTDCNK